VEGLYLVREGFIWLGDAGVEPATLGVVGPGGLFGEEALVGERAHTLAATALTYAELLFAPKEELAALLEAFPEAQGFFPQGPLRPPQGGGGAALGGAPPLR
jgi:CRP/FNR family cyclic AMP-dependent transcriptional regulator